MKYEELYALIRRRLQAAHQEQQLWRQLAVTKKIQSQLLS